MRFVMISILIALVMWYSFLDDVSDEQFYCQQVAKGEWPAYDPDIKCPKENNNETK